jgi:hypothetical protein
MSAAEKPKPEKATTYFINGEAETTNVDQLTVRAILENAGFKPADEYTLKSQNPPDDYDSQYDQSVKIHEHQRFDALHKGPTPTS